MCKDLVACPHQLSIRRLLLQLLITTGFIQAKPLVHHTSPSLRSLLVLSGILALLMEDSRWPSCFFPLPFAARLCPLQGVLWILEMRHLELSPSHRLCVYHRFWPETSIMSSDKNVSQASLLNELILQLLFFISSFQVTDSLFLFIMSGRQRPLAALFELLRQPLSLIILNSLRRLYIILTSVE